MTSSVSDIHWQAQLPGGSAHRTGANVPPPVGGMRDAIRRVRPATDEGLARKAALSGVLGLVLGDDARMRLGRYELGDTASKGGMGVVYRARCVDDGRSVAVKIMHAASKCAPERFDREVETLRSIVHENVVRFVDHGVDDEGAPYFVMEWLDGEDLGSVLKGGALGVRATIEVGLAGARGLAAAHRREVVHRDVKPSNLYILANPIGSACDVRLIDFGLAGVLEHMGDLTGKEAFVGTPQFMAPEQLDGEADFRADIYGLGATLFAALTGVPPFRGRSHLAIALAVTRVPVPSVLDHRRDVPAELDELLRAMMAKNPADRPQSMASVERALTAIAER